MTKKVNDSVKAPPMKPLFLGKHRRVRSLLGGWFTIRRSFGALCQYRRGIERTQLKCEELIRRRLDRCKGGTVLKCSFAGITARRGQLTKGNRRQDQHDEGNETAGSDSHREIDRS